MYTYYFRVIIRSMESIDARDPLPLKDKIMNVSAEIMKDFKTKGIHPLENNKLFDFLGELPKTQKDSVLERYAWKEELNLIKDSLGEQFSVCLFHPGVSTRITEFIDFSQNKDFTPTEAISEFSSHLGDVTVYRSMALTKDESDIIKRVGILAPALIDDKKDSQTLAVLLNPNIQRFQRDTLTPSSFVDDIKFRLTDRREQGSKGSISVSTSGHPEIASSVGWHASKRTDEPDVAPYLYTLQVPKILTYEEMDIMGDSRGRMRVTIGDKTFGQDQLEIFVPFGVQAKNISHTEITDIPPRWK